MGGGGGYTVAFAVCAPGCMKGSYAFGTADDEFTARGGGKLGFSASEPFRCTTATTNSAEPHVGACAASADASAELRHPPNSVRIATASSRHIAPGATEPDASDSAYTYSSVSEDVPLPYAQRFFERRARKSSDAPLPSDPTAEQITPRLTERLFDFMATSRRNSFAFSKRTYPFRSVEAPSSGISRITDAPGKVPSPRNGNGASSTSAFGKPAEEKVPRNGALAAGALVTCEVTRALLSGGEDRLDFFSLFAASFASRLASRSSRWRLRAADASAASGAASPPPPPPPSLDFANHSSNDIIPGVSDGGATGVGEGEGVCSSFSGDDSIGSVRETSTGATRARLASRWSGLPRSSASSSSSSSDPDD
mmetsp:Transcript_8360/g.22251  ORF Transcript_8360/g.22251 Transcript_8360/m.22251 type:complete len:367 (+) Transcript_8360:561-1661(+)